MAGILTSKVLRDNIICALRKYYQGCPLGTETELESSSIPVRGWLAQVSNNSAAVCLCGPLAGICDSWNDCCWISAQVPTSVDRGAPGNQAASFSTVSLPQHYRPQQRALPM